MGDVATLPQAGYPCSLNKPLKTLQDDTEPPAVSAETPCHGRRAGRDGGVPTKPGGGAVLLEKSRPGGEHPAGFPVKVCVCVARRQS